MTAVVGRLPRRAVGGRDRCGHFKCRVGAGRHYEDSRAHRGDRAKPAERRQRTVPDPEASRVARRPEALPCVLQPGRRRDGGRLQCVRRPHRQAHPDRLCPRDRKWPGRPEPPLDAVQAVRARRNGAGSSVQCVAQNGLVLVWRAHTSRSSTVRSAVIALAVWLFTAPRLICIASAICASDMSA